MPLGFGVYLASSVPGLLLSSCFLGWTAWRLARRHPVLRDRLIALPVWGAGLLVCYTQALSLVRQLHWPGMLVLTGAGAGAAWLALRAPRAGGGPPTGLRAAFAAVPREEKMLLATLAVPAALYGLWSTWLMLVARETMGDNLTYHLPRLGYWLQHQSVAPFVANDPRIGTFPPVGNILQLFPVLFLRTERLSAFTQLGSLFGTGLAIFALGRDLGWARVPCAAAAFCWLFVPSALAQATTSNVDLIASFFGAASLALAVACLRRPGGANAWACLTAAALALATKPPMIWVAFPAAVLALGVRWRRDRRGTLRLLPALAVWAFLAGGLPFLQNIVRFGSAAGFPSITWVVTNPGWATLAKNVQLVAAPFDPRGSLIGQDGRAVPWSTVDAAAGPGLGLVWLGLGMVALVQLAARLALGRNRPGAMELGVLALALSFAASTLLVMRHQPSVLRFLLPAAAVLSPALAPALALLFGSGWRRVVLVALLSAAGAGVFFSWGRFDYVSRLRWGAPQEFTPRTEMAGLHLGPLANAAHDLGQRGPGRRLGTITPQSFRERILFGFRYANAVVPLSYRPPHDLRTLDALGLDAVWIDATYPHLDRFRHPFTRPRRQPESARLTAMGGFDADFLRAYEESVERPSFADLPLLLGRPRSGWRLSLLGPAGMLFVRGRTMEAALGVLDITNENGLEERDGASFFWLGSRPAVVRLFAARAGVADLTASFILGPSLVGPRARLGLEGPAPRRELEVTPGRHTLSVAVRPGLNAVALRALDPPGRAVPGDPRTLLVGLGGLGLRWEGDGAAGQRVP